MQTHTTSFCMVISMSGYMANDNSCEVKRLEVKSVLMALRPVDRLLCS